MRYWETAPAGDREPSAGQEYAKIWQTADKIIYSKSLEDVSTARTRIEREFDANASSNSKPLRLATSQRAVRRLLPMH